jgi:predicted RNase H-like HicB family nuclease
MSPERASKAEVDVHVNKGWTVILCYDPETGQYQSAIPELQIGSCAPTRIEAMTGIEEALVCVIETKLELGEPIPDPPVVQIDDFLPDKI